MSQSCWHAPTYMPESFWLFAYSWLHVAGPFESDEKMP